MGDDLGGEDDALRELFIRYIALVIESEGTDFLPPVMGGVLGDGDEERLAPLVASAEQYLRDLRPSEIAP